MSVPRPRQLTLGAFLPAAGHHVAAWRHPSAQADGGGNLAHYIRLAQTAERAKLDAVFLADGLAVNMTPGAAGKTDYGGNVEPITLFSALSAVTSHVGFIATASTTYEDPYLLARKFASLDLLSGGRGGWNVVTTGHSEAAGNFGLDAHPAHADRYERASEFHDVVIGLWDSWEDDAFTRDKATGRFYDPAKLHPLNHQGTHFRVRGPLNVARSPQGRPVIVQAGSSPAGKDFAARTAEVIFTAQQTEEDAQAFYRDVKERLPRYHRRADELKVMPGIYPVIGSSESEAIAKYQELQDLILPEVGLSLLSTLIGEFDLSRFPADSPLPELPETNNLKSRQTLMYEIARKRRFTIRDLYLWVAGARGHWTIIGTAGQIADQLQSWFEHGAADGFNLMPPVLPTGLDDIVEHLVPELQRRGLFRREYEGSTLRDNLGLERPVNRHAAARSSAGRQSAVTA
jgi:FMN-dependent oxidoreductase (nitrilotriacetate monooxygenase family)